jgi:hypothetical protein
MNDFAYVQFVLADNQTAKQSAAKAMGAVRAKRQNERQYEAEPQLPPGYCHLRSAVEALLIEAMAHGEF